MVRACARTEQGHQVRGTSGEGCVWWTHVWKVPDSLTPIEDGDADRGEVGDGHHVDAWAGVEVQPIQQHQGRADLPGETHTAGDLSVCVLVKSTCA